MTTHTAGWFGGPLGSRSPNLPPPGPLPEKAFGPSWVANVYGTTHEQRVEALVEAGWTINPKDRDDTARTYARLRASQA